MKEDFLYYLWMFRLYQGELFTAEGERVEVISPGIRNTDSGPDFVQSRIRIGDTLWAGSVEIHVKASDWYRHGHQDDPAYHGVILHVVYEADQAVLRPAGDILPALSLKALFDPELFRRYEDFQYSQQWVSCSGQVQHVPDSLRRNFFHRLAIERFEGRNAMIDNILLSCRDDMEESCHRFFARAFGGGLNDDVFEQLARILPYRLCRNFHDNPFQMEALALGQAGFLEGGFSDDYPASLWKEYQFLRKKHDLSAMARVSWKFSRIRPAGFPVIRILQWANFLAHTNSLVSDFLHVPSLGNIGRAFLHCPHSYWETHLLPDRKTALKNPCCGDQFLQNWTINALIPMMIYYGRKKERQESVELAIAFAEEMAPEKNHIISAWAKIGIQAANALESQGLLELKKNYCSRKRCLSCPIGNYLIR